MIKSVVVNSGRERKGVNGREVVVVGEGGLSGEDTTVMFVSVSCFTYLFVVTCGRSS